MGLPTSHISRALESKLERDGSSALTSAERNLLMVSRFLIAVDSHALPALLARSPLSELFEMFDGLNAIGASTTANLLLETLHRLAPVLGVEQPARDANAIAAIAHELQTACQVNREADELCLLKFAFEHSESSLPSFS